MNEGQTDDPGSDRELSGEDILNGADSFGADPGETSPGGPGPDETSPAPAEHPEVPGAETPADPPPEPPEQPIEQPIEQPTEEMFAFEARIEEEGDLPDLDPAVRAALLESDHPSDSAAAAPGAGSGPAGQGGDEPGETTGEQTAEHPDGDGGYMPPDSSEWELPAEEAIAAEETAVLAEAAREEIRSAVDHARQTGQPWDPPRPPAGGDFQEPGRRPRYWWRFLLATLIIVFAFGSATSASVLHVVNDIASKLEIPAKNRLPGWLVKDAGSGPQTIAIIGSDARTGGGSPAGDKGRSDTTMLLRLDPDSGQIAMLSIPRDLKVDIPGYGTDKFNAAYSYGGTPLTVKTIKQLTGLQINHVINVDFQGFAMLVDAVGCVYVDVDRKYYHSNEGLAPSEMYAEIDIDAGYQKLCGPDALDYARYRHTDTDLVRASRQQDLIGEVRNRLSFGEIIKRRDELIKAFTKNATSDISSGGQILDLLRLMFDSRDSHMVQVKFPSTFTMDNGISYVEASQDQINAAVDRFLGFKPGSGAIGTLNEGEGGSAAARSRKKKQIKATRVVQPSVPKAPGKQGDGLVDAQSSGMELASRLTNEFGSAGFRVFYPRRLPEGTTFPEGSRTYHIRDTSKQPHRAYRMVMAMENADGAHYFGVQGIAGWQDPPILEAPHDEIRMDGRDFNLYFEGDRLRLVSWATRNNTYWISNSLLLTLTNDQMLGIARSTRAFTAGK